MSRPLKNALLEHVVRAAKDAIIVADARRDDLPIVFVNPAFEAMTGYAAADVLGRNCRFLQGDDRRQRALHDVREALAAGDSCEVLLRNYRKDGSMFWNQLSLSPVRERGRVTWYVGVCRDVGALRDIKDKLRNRQQALRQARSQAPDDRLTGLHSRTYLSRMLEHEWNACVRDSRRLTVFLFGVDHFGLYNETFGRRAGDSCLRRLAQAIRASFRRGSDVCARYDETRFACIANDGESGNTLAFAAQVCTRIRELCIHHPRSPAGRYVTVSAGVATVAPDQGTRFEELLALVETRLEQASSAGGDQAIGD